MIHRSIEFGFRLQNYVYSYFKKVVGKRAVGGCFNCTFFNCSKKLERMARETTDICLPVLKESNKSRFDSYSVRNSVLIRFPFGIVPCTFFPTIFLEIAVFRRVLSTLPNLPKRITPPSISIILQMILSLAQYLYYH